MSAIEQDHPPFRDKYLKQLLTGHQHSAYRLPEAIVDAWRIADAAHAEKPSGERPKPEHVVWDELMAEDAEAFRRGVVPPRDAVVVLAERREAEERFAVNEKMRASRNAVLERELVDLVADAKESIIVGALRPALAELVDELMEVVRILPEDATEATCLRGPDRVRRSWLRAEAVAARYIAVRRGWQALKPQAELDERGEFAELRNLDAVWKQPVHRNLPGSVQPPWPEDHTLRLLWIGRRGGEFWLPTDAERDAAFREHYKDRLADQEAARSASEQWRAVFA